MKPDQQHLLQELLDDGRSARRDATLLAGARILRRRRQWRAAARGLPFALILLAAGLWRETAHAPRPVNPMAMPEKIVAAPAEPQALTDDQLLALFPKTPVGLATFADGRKRLIFPRPGDEQKYVIHL